MRVLPVLVRRKKVSFILFSVRIFISIGPDRRYDSLSRTNLVISWFFSLRIMLDHMMFAHEMDDGSVNTDVNAADVSERNEQREDDEDIGGPNDSGNSNDTTANEESFDNGSGDEMTTTSNMEVVFETSDENIVVVETVECKPDFEDSDQSARNETPTTPSQESVKSLNSSTTADDKMNIMMSCESDYGEERVDDEQVEDEEIIVGAGERSESPRLNLKILKVSACCLFPTGPFLGFGVQIGFCTFSWVKGPR